MIRSFADRDTEDLFGDKRVRRLAGIERIARRKLMFLHRSVRLDDLRSPPGNRLEMLRGNRFGQHSIRINEQWRICFRWARDGAFDVEIVDYH